MQDRPKVAQRDISFALDQADMLSWHANGVHTSLFFNAMSPFFPEGERFFIRSVRRYADQIQEPNLARDVQGFIGQEAMHGREHQHYNQRLQEQGLRADKVEKFVINDLRWTEKHFSGKAKLGMTIALEHWTAIMASLLLRDPRGLSDSDAQVARLWRWHAIEETEHKAVAFEVFQTVAPGLRGYLLRCVMMLICSLFFWLEIFVVSILFARDAGVAGDLRGWAKLWWFLWGTPGMLRRIILPWLAFFKPGFHPWEDDNRAQIERWKQTADQS